MSNSFDFPGLSLVEPDAPVAQAPAANTAPMTGRRWSDGAGPHAPADPDAPWAMAQQWPHLVAALSEQAVESSNLLLRALHYLVGAGRLRPGEARALTEAMQQLRGTSLRAQQITRLASGRIRQARERVELAELLRHVLRERADELAAAGMTVTSDLEPVDVLLDPPVALSLLHALLDWAGSFSKQVQLTLASPAGDGPAQLKVRVATPPPAHATQPAPAGAAARPRGRRLNDGLHWILLRQIAASSGLEVSRARAPGAALLAIAFPTTFRSADGVSCLELGGDGAAAPLRETWVLVVARDAAVRAEAVGALRKMGIDALAAADPQQARAAGRDTPPHVLVTGYDIGPDEIARLRRELPGGDGRCPLVEITREPPSFHLSGFDRFETPKVGREQLSAELPSTVLFELVKAA